MPCQCAELPSCVNYGELEREFVRWFEVVAEHTWVRLYRCLHCDTHWQLDFDDRSDFAIKVAAPHSWLDLIRSGRFGRALTTLAKVMENWPDFDDKPYRREYFVRSHGGESDRQCTWAGCRNRALKDMAICVDHAYPEFAPGNDRP